MAYPRYIDNGGLSSTDGFTITAEFPSPLAANDLLILTFCKDGSDVVIDVAPSGFTFIHTTEISGGGFTMVTYWKRAIGTETGTVYLTWNQSSDNITSSVMYRYSNVSTSGNPPLDYGFGDASGGSPEATMDILGGNTAGNQRLAINVSMCFNTTGADDVSNASGYSESSELKSSIGSYYITAKAQEQEVPTAATIAAENSAITPNNALWVSDSYAIIPGVGWPHNYLGVINANIGKIDEVAKADIEAVNTAS